MSVDRPDSSAAPPSLAREDADVFARFAKLVARPTDQADHSAESPLLERNWLASLDLIRDVGQRLRETQRRSEQMTRNALEIAQKAVAAMHEAQERAQVAEAEAASASARAQAAEDELVAMTQRRHEPREPLIAEVDQWLAQAHRQLQQAREARTEI